MKRIAYLLLSFLLACQTSSQPDYFRPHLQLDELFREVQLRRVFPDNKTFVDSRPKTDPARILEQYQAQKGAAGFDLKAFVEAHFEIPGGAGEDFELNPALSMEDHISNHWRYLTRPADEAASWSTLIPLPHEYVVPGGRFREIYYWDSYFTMHGLANSERMDLLESMLRNFAWQIDHIGHIPNGNRTYYLSRSQPPFFGAMVSLYQHHKGTQAALAFLPQLEKEWAFWMQGAEQAAPGAGHRRVVQMPDGSLLNRYYDDTEIPRPESYVQDVETAEQLPEAERPLLYRNLRAAAESGWDFSSRWFTDSKTLATINTTNIVPVDLNSLLYHLEETISELHLAAGNGDKAEDFEIRAESRKAAINKWLWNPSEGVYGDYHLLQKAFTPVVSLAMVYPLYFGLAEDAQAASVAQRLERDFLLPGGLVTTLHETGQQWDYPNGWAPLQWMAIQGLSRYEHHQLSSEIATRWLRLNRKVFRETGRLMEKYNVADTSLHAGGGEYPLQDGFGWTNGVAISIIRGE
ncbi:alpha,alpha-trehalase TreF [Cesiribacter andamanensis]|uniref:Cytoplasmic trehalase n=1 Tax=Cesiribacter andamanensis AMV16 TaxID=1279009 RepID=M7N1H9_9BACT|nr:alpha,alpha-trehalase TreF [Cesiribacter andamanensis]EMR01147.1 Cytoplasmic trehalase [Cesiribacter andamanensis AMV16]